jgi:GT2 family glycosyltransferase
MDLSVIIVSWNARDYLLTCLRSLKEHLGSVTAEIIVVDNASSDGSPEAVKKDFPDVILIETGANLGFAKANNIGIRRSGGRYLALVNSDIRILDDSIFCMLSFMDSDHSIGMLGPRVLNADGSLQRSCRRSPALWRSLLISFGMHRLFTGIMYAPHDRIGRVDILSGCFWVIRREALDEVGLLDEGFFMYGEDKDWCKRFNNAGWGVAYHFQAEVIHYGGASSSNAPLRFYIEMHRANRAYWRKHHGRMGEAFFFFDLIVHQSIRVVMSVALCLFMRDSKEVALHKLNRSLASIRWALTGRG